MTTHFYGNLPTIGGCRFLSPQGAKLTATHSAAPTLLSRCSKCPSRIHRRHQTFRKPATSIRQSAVLLNLYTDKHTFCPTFFSRRPTQNGEEATPRYISERQESRAASTNCSSPFPNKNLFYHERKPFTSRAQTFFITSVSPYHHERKPTTPSLRASTSMQKLLIIRCVKKYARHPHHAAHRPQNISNSSAFTKQKKPFLFVHLKIYS